jgi:UDP-N-acetylglucosamine 1-carboxyvinyltransferase
VTRIDISNRGYERFTEKLAGLGADFDISSAK